MKRNIWETKVRSIKLTDNLKDCAQLLSELHKISSEASLKQIKNFLSDNRHRIFGLYDPFNDWKLLSVITFSLDSLDDIDVITVHDFITQIDERSKGYGEHLLAYVEEEWAEKKRYNVVIIDTENKNERLDNFLINRINYIFYNGNYIKKINNA